MRERRGGAKGAKGARGSHEGARGSSEGAVREHKGEHREPILTPDYNCPIICDVRFSQDCCLNSIAFSIFEFYSVLLSLQ